MEKVSQEVPVEEDRPEVCPQGVSREVPEVRPSHEMDLMCDSKESDVTSKEEDNVNSNSVREDMLK